MTITFTEWDGKPIGADGVRRPIQPGVYFGLREADYHADDALGSTSFRALASNPCKWQYDRLRPKESVDSEPMIWGRAWHCRVLEGVEEYRLRYAKPPSVGDFERLIVTADDAREFLREIGAKVSGTKSEVIGRAKEHPDCPPIFDEIMAAWREAHPNHTEITDRQAQEIEDAVANMHRDPTLSAIMEAGSLIHGAAELSIFFETDGVRRKARFDYSLPPTITRNNSIIIDLKSFTTFKGNTDEEAGIRKIYDEAFDVQTAHYMDAFDAARDLIEAGRVYGPAPSDGFLQGFFGAKDVDWVWIMLRRDAGMVPVTFSINARGDVIEHCRKVVADALDVYRAYVEDYGHDKLWTPPPKLPVRLNASSFPPYNRGLRYEQPASR